MPASAEQSAGESSADESSADESSAGESSAAEPSAGKSSAAEPLPSYCCLAFQGGWGSASIPAVHRVVGVHMGC